MAELTQALADHCFAIGKGAQASKDWAVALGDYAVAAKENEVVITNQLHYNKMGIQSNAELEARIFPQILKLMEEHKAMKSAEDYRRMEEWMKTFLGI